MSDLFESRGEMTLHTKKTDGCYYNPYGDQYVPINPDQLAEGRARAITRQVERDRCQLHRQQLDYWYPEIVLCSQLPSRGRGRGVHRVQATLTETTPMPGEHIPYVAPPVPFVGRRRSRVEREPRHAIATPSRIYNNYPLPEVPSLPSARVSFTVPENYPELAIPIFRSVPASAAASPLSTDPRAAWLEAAPVAATATDSEARRPSTPVSASPACSVIQTFESAIDPVTGQLDIKALSIHDNSGDHDDDVDAVRVGRSQRDRGGAGPGYVGPIPTFLYLRGKLRNHP